MSQYLYGKMNVFEVVCIKDCSSMRAKFHAGGSYMCGWNSREYYYFFDIAKEILMLKSEMVSDYFVSKKEYRKLKLDKLNECR